MTRNDSQTRKGPDPDSVRELQGDAVAPVIPDELINGDWSRRLVLPKQHGQLRLTSVTTTHGSRADDPSQIRFLDPKQRHSA